MLAGDVVFYPWHNAYVKYIVKHIDGDEIIAIEVKSHKLNWLNVADVLDYEQFKLKYNNEIIYE